MSREVHKRSAVPRHEANAPSWASSQSQAGVAQRSPERWSSSLRSRLAEAFLAIYFMLAPSTIPAWRADPSIRVAAMLMVGEPVTPLAARRTDTTGVRYTSGR